MTRAYWKCQAIGWSVYAVFSMLIGLLFQSGPKGWMAVVSAVNCGIGFAFSHMYRASIHRRGWTRLSLVSLVPRVIATCIGLALCWVLTVAAVGGVVFRLTAPPQAGFGFIAVLWFNWSAVYLIWSLIYFGFHFFERYKQAEIQKLRLEAAVKDAELRALKAQLNPHFLFNCLNSVRGLILEDPARAQDAVTRLGNILRYSLQSGEREKLPLREEMRFVSDYLELEGIRFDDRLRVRIEIGRGTLDRDVPPMVVQGLVENAIKHGIASLPGGGEVSVETWLEGSRLHVRVANPGRLVAGSDSTRLGLRNATDRLKLIFGADASVSLENDGNGRVRTEIMIPEAK